MSLVEELYAAKKARDARLWGVKPKAPHLHLVPKTNPGSFWWPKWPVLVEFKPTQTDYKTESAPEPWPARPDPNRVIRIEEILKVVCRHYGTTVTQVVSQRRDGFVIMPRFVAMYLSRHLSRQSLPVIGKQFGGRDHTTIMNAVAKITRLAASDEYLADTLAVLEHKIKNGEG